MNVHRWVSILTFPWYVNFNFQNSTGNMTIAENFGTWSSEVGNRGLLYKKHFRHLSNSQNKDSFSSG